MKEHNLSYMLRQMWFGFDFVVFLICVRDVSYFVPIGAWKNWILLDSMQVYWSTGVGVVPVVITDIRS